jgi:N-hydroxyarylamine O-acetyltransferase
MRIFDYLARVGISEPPPPTLAGLRALHRAHLLSIPYENLDVQLERPVTTDPETAVAKLVGRRRGGWCYEMNGTFGWALERLGFDVTRATGAVMREVMGAAAEGNHLVLKVELEEGTWLADVGFGDGPRDPIHIQSGEFRSAGFEFGLDRIDDRWWRLRNHPRGAARSFDFNVGRADEALLAEKCAYLQTSQQSPFVQNLVAQRHTPDGLSILRGRTLRQVAAQGTTEKTIETPDELITVLAEKFGLDVPDVVGLWPKICARHEDVLKQQRQSETAV